jgi:hypothetical protein
MIFSRLRVILWGRMIFGGEKYCEISKEKTKTLKSVVVFFC